ncbi:hypothetical protein Tco_0486756, partial [Tanacetum coccineum]
IAKKYEVDKLAREFERLRCDKQFSRDIIVLLNNNELLEYMSVYDNDASKSSKPSCGETLDSLGCDMHKLKESIHAIHEGLLEETITKFCEESNKKQVTNDEWIRKFIEETNLNLEILGTAIKNVEVEKLTQAILTNEDNMVNKVKAKIEKVKEVKKMPEYFKYVEDTFSSKEPINEEDVVTDSYRKVDHRMISSNKAKQEVHRCKYGIDGYPGYTVAGLPVVKLVHVHLNMA